MTKPLPEGLFDCGGVVFFDHNFDFSEDKRTRILQYRACGYSTRTIWLIVNAQYDDKMTKQQINDTITNSKINFRKRASINEKNEEELYYSSRQLQQKGKSKDYEYTTNKPLPIIKERSFIGVTWAEKQLLKILRREK